MLSSWSEVEAQSFKLQTRIRAGCVAKEEQSNLLAEGKHESRINEGVTL